MTRAAEREQPTRPQGPVPYHCVCGTTVELDVLSGGRCPACGRRYAAEVALVAASETIRMPSAQEVPIELDPDTEPGDEPRSIALDGGATTVATVEPDGRPDVPLPADRRLGHFRIVGRLGRGGMGDVYRALDESLQRYVALKVLRPGPNGPAAGEAGPLRLLQEARAQARVNHPGVVHIYFVSPDPQRPFLAMELVPGPTLADRLKEGPLPYAETIDFALQIARALRHAARYDVVHGDIKPGNILLAGDGTVKLSDFGLARRLSGRRAGPAGPITGTPHYLPPEVVAGAEPDVRSDLYALGVMLFEMTFGRRPYTVETGKLRDQIEAHRSAPPEFPDPWPADLPHRWRRVLVKLLEKEPKDRYQTHDELIDDLERVRPVALPRAGRFNRLIAWVVDLFLASAARGLFLMPFVFPSGQRALAELPFLRLLLTLASGLAPLGASWLQANWRTSPGKVLMQLRIVDRYGLTPRRTLLAVRAALQLLPVWGTFAASVLILGFGFREGTIVGELVVATTLAVSLADAAVAFARRDGRSLHDLLLRTRVVLDTRTEPEAE
jgi:hypothetical protein